VTILIIIEVDICHKIKSLYYIIYVFNKYVTAIGDMAFVQYSCMVFSKKCLSVPVTYILAIIRFGIVLTSCRVICIIYIAYMYDGIYKNNIYNISKF